MRPPPQRADTEIRKLEEGTLEPLIQTIHVVKDDWKKYMSCIPKDLQMESSGNKYNDEDIRIVEEHANFVKEKCAKIMFNEWGTSGTRRPTLRTVQQVAVRAGMMRLADEIADLLQEPHPPHLQQGPGAPVSVTSSILRVINGASSDTSPSTSTQQVRSENIAGPLSTERVRSNNNGSNNDGQESTGQVIPMPAWNVICS